MAIWFWTQPTQPQWWCLGTVGKNLGRVLFRLLFVLGLAGAAGGPAFSQDVEVRVGSADGASLPYAVGRKAGLDVAAFDDTDSTLSIALAIAVAAGLTLAGFFWLSGRKIRQTAERQKEDARQAHEAENQKRVAALETRDRDMSAILAVVSHDLRGPLVSIAGFVEILRECGEMGDKKGVSDAHERIARNINHMRGLLGGIVDLKSISQDTTRIENVDVDEIMREVRDALDANISLKGAILQLSPVGFWPCDRDLLSRALQNLVSNALHHACRTPGKVVRIFAARTKDDITITVADEGPGVAMADLKRIWRVGFRSNPESSGTGLGLATVARIAAIHGGSAWAENLPTGGAEFSISLAADAPNHAETRLAIAGETEPAYAL